MSFTFIVGVVIPIFAIILAVYALIIRPILHALPVMKEFYDDADTVWGKLSSFAWHSLTVAWSYLLAIVGLIMDRLDFVSAAIGDPELKANLSSAIGADTKTVGYLLLGISVVTLISRLRSIRNMSN